MFESGITRQNNKFYITDASEIKSGDTILYRIGNDKDYPSMFGKCLGFDNKGFIMIHDDMSIHKSLCLKLVEIAFIDSEKAEA